MDYSNIYSIYIIPILGLYTNIIAWIDIPLQRGSFHSRHSVITPSDTEAQEVEHINQVLRNVCLTYLFV